MDAHDHLTALLSRLKLTALRDQLDNLIDEAGRRELTIREALTMCLANGRWHVATSAASTWPLAWPAFPSYGTCPALTSPPSPRLTRRRSARSPPAASSPTARRFFCLARLAWEKPRYP